MQQVYDSVIVGGGPAGASCALWLARLGLSPLLVEASERLGGLGNDNPFADDWIAVLPGVTGQQVAANIDASVRAAGVPLRLSTDHGRASLQGRHRGHAGRPGAKPRACAAAPSDRLGRARQGLPTIRRARPGPAC